MLDCGRAMFSTRMNHMDIRVAFPWWQSLPSLPTLLAIIVHLADTMAYGTKEYCNMETFNATCAQDEVILMRSALFGRMRMGRCVTQNLGFLGCQLDVLPMMDSLCTGRQICRFNVPHKVLHSAMSFTKSCPPDTSPYMEAAYECIKVATASRENCRNHRGISLTSESGYISSLMSQRYGVGTAICPWKLRVQPGQRINISLVNINRTLDLYPDIPGVGKTRSDNLNCYEYGRVEEQGANAKPLTTCFRPQRLFSVHVSHTNQISLIFSQRNVLQSLGRFLLKYEAVGCEDLPPPKGGTVVRQDGHTLMMRCNQSDEVWYLTCQGTAWHGQRGNCSHVTEAWHIGSLLGDGSSFPYGILVVVAIGVALGVFFGGVLLTVVALYMKRQRSKAERMPSTCVERSDNNRAGKYLEGERLSRQWEHQAKYFTTDDTYSRGITPSVGTITDRDSGFTGSAYRPPTEDTTYFEDESAGSISQHRQHIYESPQFS